MDVVPPSGDTTSIFTVLPADTATVVAEPGVTDVPFTFSDDTFVDSGTGLSDRLVVPAGTSIV